MLFATGGVTVGGTDYGKRCSGGPKCHERGVPTLAFELHAGASLFVRLGAGGSCRWRLLARRVRRCGGSAGFPIHPPVVARDPFVWSVATPW